MSDYKNKSYYIIVTLWFLGLFVPLFVLGIFYSDTLVWCWVTGYLCFWVGYGWAWDHGRAKLLEKQQEERKSHSEN